MDTINSTLEHLNRSEKFLTQEKIAELHTKAMAGNKKAMNRLVESHLAWVLKYVTKFYQKSTPEIDLEDLFQCGVIGLMKSIKSFKPELNYTLTTHSFYYIRNECINHCHSTKFIRVPPNTPGNVEYLINSKVVSLEKIEDLGYEEPAYEDPVINEEAITAKMVSNAKTLSGREKNIILLRFWHYKTLKEVGKCWRIPRERVRQIQNKSLEALRKEYLCHINQ